MAQTPPQNTPNQDPKELKQVEDYLKKSGLNAKELVDRMNVVKNNAKEFARELSNAQRAAADVTNEFRDLSSTFKNVIDDLSKVDSTSSKINQSFKTLGGLADKLRYDSEGISKLSKRELENTKKKAEQEVANLKLQKQALDQKFKNLSTDRLAAIADNKKNKDLAKQASQYLELQGLLDENNDLKKDENNYILKTLKLTEARLAKEKKISETMGLSGKIIQGMVGFMDKLGISSEFFDNVKTDMEAVAESGKKWKTFTTGISSVWSGLGTALKDPLVQLTIMAKVAKELWDIGMGYSKAIADTGKNFALNADEAKAMVDYTRGVAANAHALAVNNKSALEANNQLNDSLGTSIAMSADLIEGQVELTDVLGLQADEAANISNFAILQGKKQEEVLKDITGQNKGLMSNKKVIAEVAKTSGQLAAFYKNSPELIAKAVVQSQKLGLSLEQTKNITDGLLDIESSLQNEYEAEALTGKNLELGRARQLAMMGDTAGAAEAMLSNLKGSAEFTNMNRIQQEAIAKSMNMSADELANSLVKQEKLSKLTTKQKQEIAQLRKDGKGAEADAREKLITEGKSYDIAKAQVSAQQKLSESVEKMKDGFQSLMEGPLGAMVDGLATAAGWIGKIFGWLGKIPGASTLGTLVGVVIGAGALIGGGLLMYRNIQKALTKMAGKQHDGSSKQNALFVDVVGGGEGGDGGGGFGGGGGGRKRKRSKRSRNRKRSRSRSRRSRGRGLGGAALSLAGGLGMDMLAGGMDGGDEGDSGSSMLDMGMDLASNVTPGGGGGGGGMKAPKMSVPTPKVSGGGGGGFFGGLWKSIKKGASAAWKGVKKVANVLNPLTYLKKLFSGNALKKVLKALPKIGTIANIAYQAYGLYQTGADAAAMKEQGMTYQDIGKSVVESVGDLGGSILGGIAGSVLGPVGGLLGSVLGGLAGSALAGLIADHTDVSGIGKEVVDLFGPSKGDTTALAKGGIVTGPINAIVGEAGNEAVVPLKEFYAKIDELIAAVKQGGNIYLDGVAVSTKLQGPMAVATRRTG